MSYDVSILTSIQPGDAIRSILVKKHGFSREGKSLILRKKTWQIELLDEVSFLAEEEIPEEVLTLVPGLAFNMEISVTPIGASNNAYKKLDEIIRFIIKELNGIGIDDQLSELILAKNPRRIRLEQPPEQRIHLLTFSWWFDNSFFDIQEDFRAFFNDIAIYCPEFLPFKYSSIDSPKHKLEEKGIDHFLAFIWDHKGSVEIQLKKPFDSIRFSLKRDSFYNRNGFIPKSLRLSVDDRILQLPGWEITLQRLWRKLNNTIKPIYSDVTIVKNYAAFRNSLMVDTQTESHDIRIDWKGIPENNGLAAFIGEPYLTLLDLDKQEFSVDSWAIQKEVEINQIPKSYRQKKVRIKPDFQDFSFNRFNIYHAPKFPFKKPENYQIYQDEE